LPTFRHGEPPAGRQPAAPRSVLKIQGYNGVEPARHASCCMDITSQAARPGDQGVVCCASTKTLLIMSGFQRYARWARGCGHLAVFHHGMLSIQCHLLTCSSLSCRRMGAVGKSRMRMTACPVVCKLLGGLALAGPLLRALGHLQTTVMPSTPASPHSAVC
jgi:hypothetical protein